MVDWKFLIGKYIVKSKYEEGYRWDFQTYIDHSEDFNTNIILSKGELLIDAGAHTGMWTVRASPYYNNIIAIEPTKKTVKILKKNLRLNKINNVTIIQKALDGMVGMTSFFKWIGGSMGNSLMEKPVNYTSDYGYGVPHGKVDTITIDSLNVEPTRIKLDVEGVEHRAIFGALKTIRRVHPDLIIEIHRVENEKRIMELLPEYSWERNTRYMKMIEKESFEQVHIIGRWKG